jgi:hypothetical protein
MPMRSASTPGDRGRVARTGGAIGTWLRGGAPLFPRPLLDQFVPGSAAYGGDAFLHHLPLGVEKQVHRPVRGFLRQIVAHVLVLEVRDDDQEVLLHQLLGLLELQHALDVEGVAGLLVVEREHQHALVVRLPAFDRRIHADSRCHAQHGTGIKGVGLHSAEAEGEQENREQEGGFHLGLGWVKETGSGRKANGTKSLFLCPLSEIRRNEHAGRSGTGGAKRRSDWDVAERRLPVACQWVAPRCHFSSFTWPFTL